MPEKASPIPTDRPRLGPYITVDDGAAAIDFYQRAFGAVEASRMAEPSGRIGHAEVRIGDAVLMLSDEYPEHGARSPRSIGGSPVMLHLYVEDADAVVAAAAEAGATVEEPVADQFYGDRGGKITDPFGHRWWIATRVEEVSDEEAKRRAAELYGMS
jgi:PhnB protein